MFKVGDRVFKIDAAREGWHVIPFRVEQVDGESVQAIRLTGFNSGNTFNHGLVGRDFGWKAAAEYELATDYTPSRYEAGYNRKV
jgi:hypothetical protein